MLKWILVMIAIWLVARWFGVTRRLGAGRRRQVDRTRRRAADGRRRPAAGSDRLGDLTEQEITDADFEEIP